MSNALLPRLFQKCEKFNHRRSACQFGTNGMPTTNRFSVITCHGLGESVPCSRLSAAGTRPGKCHENHPTMHTGTGSAIGHRFRTWRSDPLGGQIRHWAWRVGSFWGCHGLRRNCHYWDGFGGPTRLCIFHIRRWTGYRSLTGASVFNLELPGAGSATSTKREKSLKPFGVAEDFICRSTWSGRCAGNKNPQKSASRYIQVRSIVAKSFFTLMPQGDGTHDSRRLVTCLPLSSRTRDLRSR